MISHEQMPTPPNLATLMSRRRAEGHPVVVRAGSLHPGDLATLAAFWPHKDAQRRHLLRTNE
jgi:hypothetical protein